MDVTVLISVIILAVIACFEIYLLAVSPKVKDFPLNIVLTVCHDDIDLEKKLSYLSFLLSRNDVKIEKIFLVNVNADSLQKAICCRFCENFPNSFFTDTENIKNFLPKIIDLSENI